jgi:hypothetical protein
MNEIHKDKPAKWYYYQWNRKTNKPMTIPEKKE